MKECKYDFLSCLYVQPSRPSNQLSASIPMSTRDHTQNFVYCLSCDRCQEQYIGETEKSLAERFGQNRGYLRNKNLQQTTGHYFNQLRRSLADLRITVMEKVYSKDPRYKRPGRVSTLTNFTTRGEMLISFYF